MQNPTGSDPVAHSHVSPSHDERQRATHGCSRYTGGCHCGRVRFEVTSTVERLMCCNCSICTKAGYLHWIVPASAFRLLSDRDALTEYRFNTGAARHLFCSTCGVKSFYRPRSHPEGWSINARCLDQPLPDVEVDQFDGQNWEQAKARLQS